MTKDWSSVKDEVHRLYRGRCTLREIQKRLYKQDGFKASTRTWRKKFKEWGIKEETARALNTDEAGNTDDLGSPSANEQNTMTVSRTPDAALRAFTDRMAQLDTRDTVDFLRHETISTTDVLKMLHDLIEEFGDYDHTDANACSYYGKIGSILHNLDTRNILVDQHFLKKLAKKIFWDVLKDRRPVLNEAGRCAKIMHVYHKWSAPEDCEDQHVQCDHSVKCRNVARATILHVSNWDVLPEELFYGWEDGAAEIIMHAWVTGDLPYGGQRLEQFLRQIRHSSSMQTWPLALPNYVIEHIPDHLAETKLQAMRHLIAPLKSAWFWSPHWRAIGLADVDGLCYDLHSLINVKEPLRWRLAEAMLQYNRDGRQDPGRCLHLLTSRDPDVVFPSLRHFAHDINATTKAALELELSQRKSLRGLSNSERHNIIQFIVHVVTLAWMNLAPQGYRGWSWLEIASEVIRLRKEVGGLPDLKFSINTEPFIRAARQLNATVLEELCPKVVVDCT
ncbi:hypothetical protein HII31_13017 [Pseudocercospora fuligena]|uniref:Clr5 domain-containing protein n=1 Tax=Pseudocercospora fuligena TaxID=685502 RepID=A0A8H6R8Z2_9PEZI|nr:hypothetical protein HII31_13017 [Pseudocercospora fuligena]